MRTYLKLFCIALPISIALDASWIGVIASGFYHSEFGTFFQPHFNLLAAGLFYVLYMLSLIYFVLRHAMESRSLAMAVIGGAVLGFTATMTYDLSNSATLAGWPIIGALVDVAWGTISLAVTAGLTYVIATSVFKM